MIVLYYDFRTASKKQILKAYKKLAMKWHPDKYEGDDKEMAQKRFIDIASAKEVLTDPGRLKVMDIKLCEIEYKCLI